MTYDPATLAAVRNLLADLQIDRPTSEWSKGYTAALIDAQRKLPYAEPAAEPPLTAGEVRRIAREEAEAAINRQRQAELDPFYDPRTGKRAGDGPPPAPPPPPKRVEAWYMASGLFGRLNVSLDPPSDGSNATYLTHFPGVTDAASAEAFERAVADLVEVCRKMHPMEGSKIDVALECRAPFLQKEPPR